jgi:predicted O-methyltransferase YrrM
MEFISPNLAEYCEKHTSPETATLQDLNRQTHLKIMMPRMLSGHLQGRFLSMMANMIQPRLVLEIGTYTGYSALCMAEGLAPGGKIITLDINAEIESFTRNFFEKSQYAGQIDYRIGNAMEMIPAMNETFDLVFIDADKINYLNYYHMVLDKVRPGGFIVADNVLWSGKVLDEKKDKDTQAICAFNDFVSTDTRVEKVLLPVRDGLLVIRKK